MKQFDRLLTTFPCTLCMKKSVPQCICNIVPVISVAHMTWQARVYVCKQTDSALIFCLHPRRTLSMRLQSVCFIFECTETRVCTKDCLLEHCDTIGCRSDTPPVMYTRTQRRVFVLSVVLALLVHTSISLLGNHDHRQMSCLSTPSNYVICNCSVHRRRRILP